jgi:glycosyltransferase involved in cell wall biosynthesis
MLSDSLIVSLANDFWDAGWKSRHQVMSRLAVQNQVVFSSRALRLNEVVGGSRVMTPLRRPGAHRVSEHLTAYVPPAYLPKVYRPSWVEAGLAKLRRDALRRYVTPWKHLPTIVYLWHPSFAPYLDTFSDAAVTCFHLFDDLTQYPGKKQQQVEKTIKWIFSKVDCVFVASEELAARYAGLGNVHWVPNGVSYEEFAGAAVAGGEAPADIASIRAPRLGYVGTLRSQIDVDLLRRIAETKPEWSIVLVGEVSRNTEQAGDFRALAALPNVHLLGAKSADTVASYVPHLDVGLLPYRLNGAAQYCYPLKMHEYLASGIPVVSSSLSAVRRFSSVIQVARTFDEWILEIERALADVSAERRLERRAVAANNSWDRRVELISSVIDSRVRGAAPARAAGRAH